MHMYLYVQICAYQRINSITCYKIDECIPSVFLSFALSSLSISISLCVSVCVCVSVVLIYLHVSVGVHMCG